MAKFFVISYEIPYRPHAVDGGGWLTDESGFFEADYAKDALDQFEQLWKGVQCRSYRNRYPEPGSTRRRLQPSLRAGHRAYAPRSAPRRSNPACHHSGFAQEAQRDLRHDKGLEPGRIRQDRRGKEGARGLVQLVGSLSRVVGNSATALGADGRDDLFAGRLL